MHTDSGVFAIMTAGLYLNAADGSRSAHVPADAGLYIKLRSGEVVRVKQSTPVAQADGVHSSLVVLAGEGAERWLQGVESAPFRAVPHALMVGSLPAGLQPAGTALHHNSSRSLDLSPTTRSTLRAWHGRMLLPPSDALLPTGQTFQAFRHAEASAVLSAPLVLQGGSLTSDSLFEVKQLGIESTLHTPLPPGRAVLMPARRQLVVALGGGSECSLSGGGVGILCWTLCMDISSLSCGASGVGCVDSTVGAGVDGSVHCDPEAACKPGCLPPSPPMPPPSPPPKSDSSSSSNSSSNSANLPSKLAANNNSTASSAVSSEGKFCVGSGVTMYMQGFDSLLFRKGWRQSPPAQCIALFVPTWVIDSEGKMVAACIGLILLGLSLELLLQQRTAIAESNRVTQHSWRAYAFVCHAMQLTVSYLLMLAGMTMNAEIFTSVILGIAAGHALFSVRPVLTKSEHCNVAIRCQACAAANSDPGLADAGRPEKTASVRMLKPDARWQWSLLGSHQGNLPETQVSVRA